jgi:hypothetical protein
MGGNQITKKQKGDPLMTLFASALKKISPDVTKAGA